MSVLAERPLTAKGAATRARIVAAAAGLIFERGVARTTLEEVRDSAGVSNSQLYHYFTGKNALIRAVIRHQTDAVLEAGDGQAARLDSFEALEAWRAGVVAYQRGVGGVGGCPLGSLVGELADGDDEARRELDRGFARWSAALAEGLSSMLSAGVLRPEADPERLAVGLLVALQGGLVLTQVRRSTEPLEVALSGAIDQVRRYAA